ncbi:MAG: 50S ribosomal protein L10, partial [Candidatus Levybacteria bacterium RIFOXYB1_FULL_40_17]
QGLTHHQLEGLKKELKKKNASFSITKNTLLKISVEKSKKYADLLKDYTYEGPTAVLFVKGEFLDALKELAKLNKTAGLPKIKIGILDGQSLDEEQVLRIASLPNKETLLAQLAGMLNSPISGLVFVLNANLQKLVFVLNEISKNKPASQASVAAPKPVVQATDEAMPVTVQAPSEEVATPAREDPEVSAEPTADVMPQTAEEAVEPVDTKPTENTDVTTEGGDK